VRFSIEKRLYFCSGILIALSRYAEKGVGVRFAGKGVLVLLWYVYGIFDIYRGCELGFPF